jgi:hypothetical protein
LDLKINEVYTLKLNSGEELVSKITSVSDTDVGLHDPLSVAPGPQGVGLIPSLFTADPKGDTRLNKNSIAIYALADASIKSKYIEATTGIKIPDKKLIMG